MLARQSSTLLRSQTMQQPEHIFNELIDIQHELTLITDRIRRLYGTSTRLFPDFERLHTTISLARAQAEQASRFLGQSEEHFKGGLGSVS